MIYPALDAILLFILSIPVVMRYRILPIIGTPYWLFGVLFLILTLNIYLSLYIRKNTKLINLNRLKYIFIWVTLGIVLFGTMITAIVDRSKTAPEFNVHDIILQQEEAMRFLLSGKNPYKENYLGTSLEKFNYAELGQRAINPALNYFVMPPWYLLFPFFFYFFSLPFFGFFDGRIALIFCMLGLLIILSRWFKNKQIAILAVILTALNPATVDYLIEGRSDVFALFWFVASIFLLSKYRFSLASIVFGLALLSKQTIWFAIPFFYYYLFLLLKNKKSIIKYFLVTLTVVSIFAGPFVLWDAKSFFDSTVGYLSGGVKNGYPISGYGLGMVLYDLKVIKNIHGVYPFWLWQIVFGLPVLYGGLYLLKQKPTVSRLLSGYGFTLLIVWYFSRYFNNSHLGYLSSIFLIGIFKEWDENNYERSI